MSAPNPFQPPRKHVSKDDAYEEVDANNSANDSVNTSVNNAENVDADANIEDTAIMYPDSDADSLYDDDFLDDNEEFSLDSSEPDDENYLVDDDSEYYDDSIDNADGVDGVSNAGNVDSDNTDGYIGKHSYDYDDRDFAPSAPKFDKPYSSSGKHRAEDANNEDDVDNDVDNYASDVEDDENNKGSKGAIIGGFLVGLAVLGAAGTYWFVTNQEKVTVASATEYISHDFEGDACADFEELECSVNWRFNNQNVRGELVEQSLAVGEKVSPGETITLVYSLGREIVEVPNVVGLSEYDALEQLYQAGLDVTQVSRVDADAKAGTVTEILGAEVGTEVFNGTELTINVANGSIVIPDWSGKTREFVESEAENLNVDVSFKEEESELPAGTVISQSVKDESVSAGDAIEVVIAKSFENEQVKIPDVLELSEQEAQSVLAEAGFRKITTVVVQNNQVTERQVTQVIPGEGKEVSSDSDITIIVSEPESAGNSDNNDSNDGNSDNNGSDAQAETRETSAPANT